MNNDSFDSDSERTNYKEILPSLEELITTTPSLKNDIEKVLSLLNNRSYYWNNKDLKFFINFFKEWLVYKPKPWAGPEYIQPFDEIANSIGAEILFNNNIFNSWFVDFLDARGAFLSTPESLDDDVLAAWKSFPDAQLDKYIPPQNKQRYETFIDIFLRVPKCPFEIDKKDDQSVIVSPASGKIHQLYTEDLDTNFKVKRDVINIRQALNDSTLAAKFIGGKIADILLWFTDYHYFHSPIAGEIVEIGEYAGSYNYNFKDVNWYKALAKHKRTCYVIKSKQVGHIAMIPVGFWGVGSIVTDKKIKKGYSITKGEKIGRFGYGGSSILLVFEPDAINFTIENIDKEWKTVQPGKQIGLAA